MRKLFYILLCSFFYALAVQVPANAGQYAGSKAFIKTGFDHAFNSRISGTDTEIASNRYSFGGSYSYFTLSYDYTDYTWKKSGDSGLTASGRTPWTGLNRVSLGARKNFLLSREWMLSLGGGVNSAFEKEISDSLGARADFSFIRIFDNGWTSGVGVIGLYHPVKSRILPIFNLSYAPAGDLGLSARIGFPETMFRYGFNSHLAARGYVGYSATIYRLKNNSPVQDKGYFRDRAIRLGMDLEFKPFRSMSIALGPYYIVERKWEIYDKNQRRKQRERLENTPGIRMNLSWNF